MKNSNLSRIGKNNGMWKGEKVLYGTLHDWVSYHKFKANYCTFIRTSHSDCSKRFEWASISHRAKRDLNDYMSLCVRHHREYDGNMPQSTSSTFQTRKKISESIKKHWIIRKERFEEAKKFFA